MTRLDASTLGGLLGTSWRDGHGPAYRALSDAVVTALRAGRLTEGTRLPAERVLAGHLGLSRGTVAAAYEHLRARGAATSRRGSGTVVVRPGEPSAPVPRVLDLAQASLPAADGVQAAVVEAAAHLRPLLAGRGYHPAGVDALRDAVAARYERRGLATGPDQVVAADGALHGLGLLAGLLLRPGDAVVVESPAYPGTLDLLRRAGARLLGVPVHRDGWDLDRLEVAVRRATPRMVVLVADFSNPTGALLDVAGRERVCALLAGTSTTLVVDETFCDLHLEGPAPGPPVGALGAGGDAAEVVHVGSLSKSVWGGLRSGWVRAPSGTARALADHRARVDHGGPVLPQLAAALLVDRLDVALDRRLADVRRRRGALAAAVRRHLPGWDVPLPGGGLSSWARLPAGLDAPRLVAAAAEHAVRVVGGDAMAADLGDHDDGLRLPFTLPPEQLEEAVRRLAAAAAAVDLEQPRPAPVLA